VKQNVIKYIIPKIRIGNCWKCYL